MSKIALQGDASGTGTFTIASPNSNSNYTLTLPSSTGTVVVTGGAQTIEFAAGTAAAPSITFTGDTNTGIFSPGADTIAFSEGGAEAMRIDSSGRVGIGTTSPSTNLTIGNGGGGNNLGVLLSLGARTNFYEAYDGTKTMIAGVDNTQDFIKIGSLSSHSVGFVTGNAERMRIDSSGNVGIGSATARNLEVTRSDANTTYGSTAAQFPINVRNTDTTANNWAVIGFNQGASSYANPAFLGAQFASSSAASLVFGTSSTERARITSGGNFLIGQTSASSSSFLLNCVGGGILTTRVNIGDIGGFSDGSTLYLGSDSTNSSSWNQSNANYRFGSNRGGCVVAINPGGYTYEGGSGTGTRTFAVNSNGNVQNTNNSYGSLSDAKLKENIVDASPKLDDLMKVKIRNFNLIADESKTKQIGVIAQELEEVFPRMIEEHIDYTYEDYVNEYGNNDKKAIPTGTVTKEVKYSVFVPMLIKAIQELKAITDAQATRIEALEAEVAALKGQ